ncbi:hypothetical protein WICMUC_005072 [Wickerhamomyces mucosus]|uniref:Importin N-terminal domain-containing protein n=1 Tax=Wickerhamomyces mucosus TaxID=1378264 RepID=A0A9P8T7F0_9ASCO|nr:hypothetical protein WICMUC_005072 [Wickerhamomyces mucosus]
MDANGLSQIVNALKLIHSPKSSNQTRQEAQAFLEQVKKQDESPFWGYELALPNQDPVVRHFGLTLLQNSINRQWIKYNQDKKLTIRKWVIELANNLQSSDPHFLREKLAFLWVSVAKRTWGSYLNNDDDNKKASYEELVEGWSSMDQDLSKLWVSSPQTRELSLIIFRTLFEDVYVLDDPISQNRNYLLSSSCANVLLPEALLNNIYNENVNLKEAKALNEGWFLLWQEFLNESIRNGDDVSIIKTLETFKTCLNWPYSSLLTQSQILKTFLNTLLISNIKIKNLTTDCLHILFTRSFNTTEDLEEIVGAIFKPEGIQLLTNIYGSIRLDEDDIDDELYSFAKKLSEMIVSLSEHFQAIDLQRSDIYNYLKLILQSTASDSLTISAVSLNFWGFMLRSKEKIEIIENILPDLLEVASSKLVNFGDLNEEHITQKFISFDYNSQSDGYSFLSNYKKLVDDIVRLTICIKAEEGLVWLNNRLENFFGSEIGRSILSTEELDYHDIPFMLAISQLDIIEASVRGIVRWKIWYSNQDYNEKLDILTREVDQLLSKLLSLEIKDPIILKKLGQVYVQFLPLLNDQSIFKIIERLLEMSTYEYPSDQNDEKYNIVKDLRSSCVNELNRIALIIPDNLKNILDDLERVFEDLLKRVSNTEAVHFKCFLLVVSQRTAIPNKEQRFIKIVEPEIMAWTDPVTVKGLSDLPWFMERLGIVQIADYFKSRDIKANDKLLDIAIDEQGLKLKSELKERWTQIFPIRTTRLLVQYSIEKLPKDSQYFKDLLKLWKPRIVPIIPHILQLLYQIQSYHNPANWTDLPEIVQSFVKDTTIERFWQMGVSIQSRDSFLEENVKAMHTLRDFADSVGQIIRYTREYVYLSISAVSQLDDTFYTIPDIADIFWRAATGEKIGITLHSWKHMINVALRPVIKNCPPHNVDQFLGKLLPQMFNTLDEVLMKNWEKVYVSGLTFDENDEQLSEEMMEEHLLRQVTQVIIRLLVDCVGQYGYRNPLTETQLAVKKLIFSNKSILAPFLQIVCHIIMFKDTRCSFNVVLIMRAILNEIVLNDEEVDNYLCEHLTKALLHVLTDDFYKETQYEAAYVLTSLYINLRSRGSYMGQIMMQYLPNITQENLVKFEQDLANCNNSKEQRNVLLEYIQSLKEKDDDEELIKKQRAKQLEQVSRKKKNESNVLNDPFTENGALGSLFGDN